MKKRLDYILSHNTTLSRADAKKALRSGEVCVDGVVIRDPAHKADPEENHILLYGKPLIWREFIYLMMNKPAGVICATEDAKLPTVLELLKPEETAFCPAPVGRLDRDTVGLLLLTNDGELTHRILSPKRHIPKRYYAQVSGQVRAEHIQQFREGVVLEDGYRTMPAELEILKSDAYSEIIVTIYEGKFHQVKRMFEAISCKVTYLKRLSVAGLELDESLQEGEYRELTEEEHRFLLENC